MGKTSLQYKIERGDQPLVAIALHHGHQVRNEVASLFTIDDADRLREEDSFTGEWTAIAENRVIVETSRFEVDLNRYREEAVYSESKDSWGLTVWKEHPDPKIIDRSLAEHDSFYAHLHDIFSELRNKYDKFIVYDLHAYNHMRNGPDGVSAGCESNPEVNVGTATMKDRTIWAPIIDRFIGDLSSYDYCGRQLDVRENVKFFGRQLAQWAHNTFPGSVCVLSIEFKKFFMDEWSGQLDRQQFAAITDALKFTTTGVLEELKNL